METEEFDNLIWHIHELCISSSGDEPGEYILEYRATTENKDGDEVEGYAIYSENEYGETFLSIEYYKIPW